MKKYSKFDAINGFMLALLGYFCVSLMIGILFDINNLNTVAKISLNVLGEIGFLLCLPFVNKNKSNFFDNISFKKPNIKQILICVTISIVAIFSFVPFNNLFLFLLQKIGYNPTIEENMFSSKSPLMLIYTIICMAIVPAICEELVFRGVCFNGLKNQKSKTFAIIVSATMFMIIHMNLSQSIYQFWLGVIFAMVILITNCLPCTMLIHFLNNAIVIIVTFFQSSTESFVASNVFDYILPILILLIGVGMIFLLLKLLKKVSPNNEKIKENQNNLDSNLKVLEDQIFFKRFVWFSIIAIFIYIVIVASNFITNV